MTDHDDRPRGVHRWLAPVSLVIVALAAITGWAASFVGLHAYGLHPMAGYNTLTAWLIPGTFDGAAFACTLMTYRASIHGRSALRGRVLMWAFTAVSSWINWIHQPTTDTRMVAAGLPVAAVAVFDVVLLELRADYETRHGRRAFRLRPGLLLIRWLVDRTGTTTAFRDQITNIPVHHLVGLATNEPHISTPVTDQPPRPPEPASASALATVPAASPAPPSKPMRVKLPPAVTAEIQRVHAHATAQGRDLTAADVQNVIKVPEHTAQQIAADYAAIAA